MITLEAKRKRNLSLFPKLVYPADQTIAGFQYLNSEGLQLVNKLIEWYRYYDGEQWVDKDGETVTPEEIRAANNLDYEPTMITVNLVAWFIDRLAAFMFERSLGLACPIEQIDDSAVMAQPGYQPSEKQKKSRERAASREWLLYRVMKQNLMAEKLMKAGKDYNIAGGVCAKLHYDKTRGLRVIWRPRLEYWPIYSADDVDVLEKIHFTAFVDDETIWKQTYWLDANTGSCWMEEGLYGTDLKLKKQLLPPTDQKLPFIPVEIFSRGGLTGETEGRSLVDALKSMNDEVNNKISDNADSLRFGMFAIKVIVNAILPSKEEIRNGEADPLQIAPNALWSLQGDGELNTDAKTIEHKFEYMEALKEHLEMLISMMHRLASVPNVSPDQVKGLGQLSGFAIKLLYGSIISATNQNMIIWRPRLQRLFGKALYMLNVYDSEKHYNAEWLRDAELAEINAGELDDLVEVKTTMPIPENELELVDRELKKMAGLLESIRGAMDNLGIENPEAKLAEILSEKASIREAMGGLPDEQEIDDDDDTGGGGEE